MSHISHRYIPPHLFDAVTTHAMMTRASIENPNLPYPGVLGIQGPSGSGKSSSVRSIANSIGAPIYEVHAKELASQWEGQAIVPLRDTFIEAALDETGFQPILLLEDPEMSDLRVDEKYTGTNNSHHTTAYCMGIIDNPHEVRVEKPSGPDQVVKLKRPPAVIMTLNNTEVLHGPLTRDGRSTFVTLDPRGKELEKIVAGMYPDVSVKEVRKLVKKFPDKPVAFFAEIGKVAARRIVQQRARDCDYRFDDFDWTTLGHEITVASLGASYDALLRAAYKHSLESTRMNFLSASYAKLRMKQSVFPLSKWAKNVLL